MKILLKQVQTELSVKGSKFLSELIPCDNQMEVKNILKSQKLKYKDATHVVHAFILGLSSEIMGLSDDGEPSSTAGRPMLDVLKGSGATNLILTVTRWFGGTLLGTGGLVKAYGDSAKSVLLKAVQENAFEDYVCKKNFSFSVDYGFYKIIKKLLADFNIYNLVENFDSSVNVSGQIKEEEFSVFKEQIKNATNGNVIL